MVAEELGYHPEAGKVFEIAGRIHHIYDEVAMRSLTKPQTATEKVAEFDHYNR
jgi:hypothetical protein